MTSPRRFAPCLLLVCAAAAVSAQPQAPTMPGYPALGAQAEVKLLAPGAAPRRALRYTVASGAKSTMEISQSATIVANGQQIDAFQQVGQPQPEVRRVR